MYLGKRILAFIVDYFLLILAFIVISIGTIYEDYFSETVRLGREYYIFYAIGLLVITLAFFVRDAKNGQSMGKRLAKIKVVDKNGRTPRLWQLFLRNITIFIWPVEAPLLLSGRKRIGDIIAGTDVVSCK